MGVACAIMWWTPRSPLYCKLVNRGKETAVTEGSHVLAKLIALNVRDAARFHSLFDPSPSTVDPPPSPPPAPPASDLIPSAPPKVDVRDANTGNLTGWQKGRVGHGDYLLRRIRHFPLRHEARQGVHG